eukprot:6835159-Alexandrium_andersonii.AAC.1
MRSDGVGVPRLVVPGAIDFWPSGAFDSRASGCNGARLQAFVDLFVSCCCSSIARTVAARGSAATLGQ